MQLGDNLKIKEEMMALFRGQFQANKKAQHVFTTDNQALTWGGLASFTLFDLDTIQGNTFHQQNINTGLTDNGYEAISDFTLEGIMSAVGGVGNFEYKRFNNSTKKYEDASISISELQNILLWYEDNIDDTDTDQPPAQLRKIRQIQNSLEESATTGTFTVRIGDAGQLKRERVIANQGVPVFADVPKTPAGTPYSLSATRNAGMGNYKQSKPSDDVRPGDAVVAPTRFYYDQTTGTWEYPSSLIAKLLEALDSADINANELTSDQADAISSSSYYDTSNSKNESGYTSALAMPLSIEQGNPHMFGPNMVDCDGNVTPEKIRVINRGPREYAAGERVFCHWIGGEWIVGDMGEKPEPVPEENVIRSNWQFAKFIASAATYFMNDYEEDAQHRAFGPLGFLDIEETVRSRYYQKGNPNFSEAPTYIDASNFTINSRIIQSSIFDQYKLGADYIAINLSLPPPNVQVSTGQFEGFYLNSEYPFFWGPVFPNGHRKTFVADDAGAIKQVTSATAAVETAVGVAASNLNNVRDRRQIPAEIAVNSFESPVESYYDIALAVNNNDFNSILSGAHYNYRFFENGSANSLPPLNPSKVQFTALTSAMAAMDDLSTEGPDSQKPYEGAPDLTYGPRQFRRMRNEYAGRTEIIIPFPPVVPIPANMGLGDALTRGNPYVGEPTGGGYTTVAYDIYNHHPGAIKQTAHNIGAFSSTAGYGDDGDGAEVYGIITAKNTVGRSSGGTINFSAGGFFGAFSAADTNVAQSAVQSFMRSVVGLFSSGGNRLGQRSSSWGVGTSDPDLSQFGDTALYVRVFDYHPREQTVFIAPFFAVLHFAGGTKGTVATTTELYFKVFQSDDGSVEAGQASAGAINYAQQTTAEDVEGRIVLIDQATYNTDFRVPTGYSSGRDFSAGTTIGSGIELVRPTEYWNVDTVARGQLLTGGEFLDTDGINTRGGFVYKKRVIGLDSLEILDDTFTSDEGIEIRGDPIAGESFAGDEVFQGPNGVKVTVTPGANGAATKPRFALEPAPDGTQNEMRGEGFMPEDFRGGTKFQPGFEFSITNENGSSATIVAKQGIVYEKVDILYAPRYHGFYRLTDGPSTNANGPGTEAVQTIKQTQVEVTPNSDGAYDCFYFFRNDITHTTFEEDGIQGYDRVQYVDLTVS